MIIDGLKDKVVLISGATGALGSALVEQLAHQDVRLALAGTTQEKLDAMARSIPGGQERLLTMAVDLTQEAEANAWVDAILEKFGTLHVLLNTVGGWSGGAYLQELSVPAWNQALALNLQSAFLLSRAVLPTMLAGGWGRIVHVGSRSAIRPRGKDAGYAVAKAGLITLTEVIAAELKGTGVTANVVLPGIMDTLGNRTMMPDADTSKWVLPAHVAEAMLYLCTDAAAPINGASIPLYGNL